MLILYIPASRGLKDDITLINLNHSINIEKYIHHHKQMGDFFHFQSSQYGAFIAQGIRVYSQLGEYDDIMVLM